MIFLEDLKTLTDWRTGGSLTRSADETLRQAELRDQENAAIDGRQTALSKELTAWTSRTAPEDIDRSAQGSASRKQALAAVRAAERLANTR